MKIIKNRMNMKKAAAAILILFTVLTLLVPAEGYAASCSFIRVGLTRVSGKSLKITNKNIVIGYSIKNSFVSLAKISSPEGFSVKPATGPYTVIKKRYAKIKNASETARKLINKGFSACVIIDDRDYFTVALYADDTALLKKAKQQVKKLLDCNFSENITELTSEVLFSAKNLPFMFRMNEKLGMPQIKCADKDGKFPAVGFPDYSYRGRIEFTREGGMLKTVNVVPLEEYLYGVVPAEMSSSWPEEALKAQAVCARSYAMTHVSYGADYDFESLFTINDTTEYQVYKGYGAETEAAVKAVDKTAGKMIYYKNEILPAFFYSTSGGATESIEDVWGTKTDALKGVPDLFETDPEMKPWIRAFTYEDIGNILNEKGCGIGTVTAVKVSARTGSLRVAKLKIKGTDGVTELTGENVRTYFSLPSTKYSVVTKKSEPYNVSIVSNDGKENILSEKDLRNAVLLSADGLSKAGSDDDRYIVSSSSNLRDCLLKKPSDKNIIWFAGQGYGHGVGMSQSGAKGMAEEGYNYKQILKYYYRGITIR